MSSAESFPLEPDDPFAPPADASAPTPADASAPTPAEASAPTPAEASAPPTDAASAPTSADATAPAPDASPFDADDPFAPRASRTPPRSSVPRETPTARPDWLVDADVGATDEQAASESKRLSDHTGPLKLVPKSATEERKTEISGPGPLKLVPKSAASANPAAEPPREKATAWTAAASSVPVLKREPRPEPAVLVPLAMDDAPLAGMPELADDRLGPPPASPLPPLKEEWWAVALDAARSNIQVQILLAVVVLGIVAIAVWPHGEPSVSLSTLHQHPTEWDGRTVAVHGRACEVFTIGDGHTYYLRQGRDSIVVFTRHAPPHENQSLTVKGSISTGYMDGVARQSLFETGP